MQQKMAALFGRIAGKKVPLFAGVAVVFTVVMLGISAGAAMPAMKQGWVASVNGVAVAGADTESELTGAYEALVDSYRTEHTVSTQVIDMVEITEGEYSTALPQGEAVYAALEAAVSVRTEEHYSITETINLDTVVVMDDTMYIGEYTTQIGNAGEQVTETSVTRINGEVRLCKRGGTHVTVEPVATVLTLGTEERPEYIWPTHGVFTGNFGIDTINGAHREHKGIDVASSKGTNIYASRGGTVVYAGWNSGGYGNLIIIEHDNATQTYYAHNTEILVDVGDVVEQGDHIGEMGATGRVTGVHCHFELRSGAYTGLYSGTPIDPMDYLDRDDL